MEDIQFSCVAADGSAPRRRALSHREKRLVVTSLLAVSTHLQHTAALRRSPGRRAGLREAIATHAMADSNSSATVWDAPFLMANAIVSGVLPRETPRWWIRRRTGGTWQDLIIDDDATEDYFHEKLRMTRGAFYDIVAACTPFLQRFLTHYRTPLMPEQLVAFALYRWASGETFDSATSSFGMGRSSGIKVVRDVTNAILSAYPDKIAMPTGRRLLQVTRALAAKGFPNCFGCMDCSHVYVDKPANALAENYFDRKQQYFVIAQVVVDLDMRVLDVHVRYPGSIHDARVLINSSLYRRAEAGTLFLADAVDLPYGVRTRGYVLADNGYGPLPWLVVPYGGVVQPPDEAHFDTCHKSSRNVVEWAFGRLEGMWRLFLRQHKTNMENLPQQFTAVCILHNLLIEAGIEFDERLLVDRDADGNERPIDLGMHEPAAPVSQDDATDDALALRDALSFRMHPTMA
ncbi:hypothetical protein CBR_g38564 [Chara braunii]|uniref:DDE Tnp4 domain-containing protein n=1 Tax=Chara braunii TaxID=69332 RepID=A0A388K0F3_CHABU|nr:hypothetical protein CBR_g38564 [Chara braunii]|eukprot:GBG63496.1 hypothetical protein CBR_g38564 [Chara braunii]